MNQRVIKTIRTVVMLAVLFIPGIIQQSPPPKQPAGNQTTPQKEHIPPIEEQQVVIELLQQRALIDAQIEGALQMMMRTHKLSRDEWRPVYDKTRVWFVRIEASRPDNNQASKQSQ